jgi:hypothetical protein
MKSDGSVGQLPGLMAGRRTGSPTAHGVEMHARGRRELRKLICHQQISGVQTFAREEFLLSWNVFA